MMCQDCNQRMQPETTVQVVRLRPFARPRAIVSPGWHCWNCETTISVASGGASAPNRPVMRRPAAARSFPPMWQTIDRAAQPGCANAQA